MRCGPLEFWIASFLFFITSPKLSLQNGWIGLRRHIKRALEALRHRSFFGCRKLAGLMANGSRAENVGKARALLDVAKPGAIPDDPATANPTEPPMLARPCPCCGGRMLIIATFARGCQPNYRPETTPSIIRIDMS